MGAVTLVEERLVGLLGAFLDGVQRGPCVAVEPTERVLVVRGRDAYVRNRHGGHCRRRHRDRPADCAPTSAVPPRAGQDGGMTVESPVAPGSRIAIAGASGLIGSALARSLTDDGYEVLRLVRRAPRARGEVRWDPDAGQVDVAGLDGCAAVVNLMRRGGRVPPLDGGVQGDDPHQPGARHEGTRRGRRIPRHTAERVRQRQRDRLLRLHGRPGRGRVGGAGGGVPVHVVRREGATEAARRPGSARRSPVRGWWWPGAGVPGVRCSRCSRPVWAGGWGTAASTGASSPSMTRSPPCAI